MKLNAERRNDLPLSPDAAIAQIRNMMTEGRIEELNTRVTDDFFAVFALGQPGHFETYDALQYRQGNIAAHEYYHGQNPRWEYTDFSSGVRGEIEYIVSSAIDFTLNGQLQMKALVTEVYRLVDGQWNLARQYMEKYQPQGATSPHN